MQAFHQSTTVDLQIGDRVRTDTGHEGWIIVVSFDRTSAYVQLKGSERNSTLTIYPLAELTRIVESENGESPGHAAALN